MSDNEKPDHGIKETIEQGAVEAVHKAEDALHKAEDAVLVGAEKAKEEMALGMDKTMKAMRNFFRLESSGGLLLMAATVLAMVFANTALAPYYDGFLKTYVTVTVDHMGVDKPLILWINDGLMAIFFLLVGLEIKREVLEGELSCFDQAILPAIAAFGGILVPALIFTAFNNDDPIAVHGWAIPAATDIAFALGVLSLFGRKVPISLKIFLTAVAVIDDLAAIVIIAFFYTANLSAMSLIIGIICAGGLLALNLSGSRRTSAYVLVGLIMWFAVLKSGVHATLAGVVLGLMIPHKVKDKDGHSLLRELEHGLHPWVAYMVLPLFAFANAGVNFGELSFDSLLAPVPLGIAVGLFVGKQVGVFGFSFIAIKTGLAKLPRDATWLQFYGIALLCGIGFTMSLFIGTLAYADEALKVQVRVGVLMGSIVSGVLGYMLIRHCVNRCKVIPPHPADYEEASTATLLNQPEKAEEKQ